VWDFFKHNSSLSDIAGTTGVARFDWISPSTVHYYWSWLFVSPGTEVELNHFFWFKQLAIIPTATHYLRHCPLGRSLFLQVITSLCRYNNLESYYDIGDTAKLRQFMKWFYNRVDVNQFVAMRRLTK
jgi:hypothetical protein